MKEYDDDEGGLEKKAVEVVGECNEHQEPRVRTLSAELLEKVFAQVRAGGATRQ